MTWYQHEEQNHNIKIINKSFERVKQFRYFWTTQTNQNYIHEEIRKRLKSGIACYHLVQNLVSSTLPFKNIKIKIYITIILPALLYGCETWPFTLREEHWLGAFENRGLRNTLGPERDEVTGEWRKLQNEKLNDLYCTSNIIWLIKSGRVRWAGHVAHTVYRVLVGRPEGMRQLGSPRWVNNIKMDLQKVGKGAWTGLMWLRVGRGGGHLRMW